MPALIITAVDHTTGQFTSAAHGQVTGNGPAALFAGSGGAIPAGLTGNTDLYLIVVDANTFKVADSSAHALAGTALTFSGNGTLPLSLGIGIPYRRARTYAALSQVKSADLDSLQDTFIALHDFLTRQSQSIFTQQFELPVAPIDAVYGASASYDQTNHYASNSGAAIVTMPIHGQKVGDTIRQVDFNHYGNAGAYISVFSLQKITAGGVVSIPATSGSISTPTGASWNTYTLVVGSPAAIAPGEVWFLEWAPSSAVQRLQGAIVRGDRS